MDPHIRGARTALSFLVLLPGLARADARENAFQQQVRPLVHQYCIACHNARLRTAGVVLEGFEGADSVAPANATWEKVLRKLRTGEMPPAGLPRPPQPAVDRLLQWLTAELDRAAAAHPDPGRVTVHRLNRAEYDNAVRDLLAVDFRPAGGFPADDSGYGFDNVADVLSMPPVLMEKYLAAASKVSRMALGRERLDAVLEHFSAPRSVSQSARLSETAPAASRGGLEIEHRFPADAEYVFRVRLRGAPDRKAPEIVDVLLDGQRLQRYETRFDGREENETQRLFEFRAPVAAGRRRLLASFLRDDSIYEDPAVDYAKNGMVRRNRIAVDWVEIGGPFNVKGPGNTESRRIVLSCRPDVSENEQACAAAILGRLARRAWRRPVSAEEVGRLLRFFAMGRQETGEFEGGVELALKAILVSPYFLFRVERDPAGVQPGDVYELGDLELASRLSFFLWSSIPDEALLSTAERGELRRPQAFEAQARRMLHDRRSRALTENFAGQWLHLRNLESIRPDPERFPDFNDELRRDMLREAELFFEAVIKEDRTVLDFLDARFTFLNERLARYYGIDGVEGARFRKVELADARRGGVLTMGSVLAVTSYPTRTSPVIRGKWVLENLLGAPPPPPPPEVPPLQEAGLGITASMRQRLEQHRTNPACAACHAKMDPIGFALENYDAIGRWRTHEGSQAIDASGKLASGIAFRDAAELKHALRERPQEFVLAFTEKLLTYALGRGIEPGDRPAIRTIARDAANDDYRLSSIVLGIAKSAPFRLRRAAQPPAKEGLHASE